MSLAGNAAGATPVAAAVACEELTFDYPDGTRAIEDVTFAIPPGELFGLLGPNGAGKTTLIRQITTELTPTRGVVRLFGLDAHANRDSTKRRLGVVPQQAGLFEGLRVGQHLHHFASLKGLGRAEGELAAERVAVECGLAELLGRRVRNLSGGQRRRLLVALALLGDSDILMLDEPTVGLDPVARRGVWETIRRQSAAGKTILLTSHYLEEIERLAHRIGFIQGGRLSHVGTPAELFRLLGRTIRVSSFDPATGIELSQHLFDTLEEARAFVRARGLESYFVGRVRLEDAYLRLVGTELGEE